MVTRVLERQNWWIAEHTCHGHGTRKACVSGYQAQSVMKQKGFGLGFRGLTRDSDNMCVCACVFLVLYIICIHEERDNMNRKRETKWRRVYVYACACVFVCVFVCVCSRAHTHTYEPHIRTCISQFVSLSLFMHIKLYKLHTQTHTQCACMWIYPRHTSRPKNRTRALISTSRAIKSSYGGYESCQQEYCLLSVSRNNF